jgi:hypothetical protein
MMNANGMRPDISKLNLSNRSGIIPLPFGPARGREIWSKAVKARLKEGGAFSTNLRTSMQVGEWAYLVAVHETIPSKGCSYTTAFQSIMQGEI